MSTPTAEASAPPSTGTPDAGTGFTHRQILVILSGLLLGMFLAALDQNIVSTSIRTIADDLQGLNLQAWATTAYLITATISTPLYGKMSDLYGRKPFFLFAIGIFVAGSVLCTIATSMYELAAFRAVQGLGAGGLMSLALTIIGDIVPPRQRARYQGYFLAVFGTSSVIGPVVGGFFAGQDSILGITGWRWVFLVNVPIGLLAFFVVFRVLNLPHTRREHRIDWPGAAALSVALVPLLIVAEQGREWGWASPLALSAYGIGLVGLIGFIASERHYGDDALLPLRLFQNSVFSLTSLIAVITGVGMFGGIAIVPQYLQIVTGSTPTEAGLEMVPLVVGIMIASIVSGQLTSRTGRYKVFPIIGLGLMTIGMLLFHFLLHFDTPYGQIAIIMVVFGLGLGNCMQTLVVAVQNAVPPRDMGVATASATFFRQMGGTLGVAVFLSILFSTVSDSIAAAFTRIAPSPAFRAALADPAVRANPANAVALDPASGAAQIVQDSSVLQRMDPRLSEPFLVGFSDSMDLVFLVAACVIAVGFVLIWFMKEIPLRTQSGIQARDAEDRAHAGVAGAPAGVEGGAATAALSAPTGAPPVPADVQDARATDARDVPAAYAAGGNGYAAAMNGNGHHVEPGEHGHHRAEEHPAEHGAVRVIGRVRGGGPDGAPVDAGVMDDVSVTLHDLDGTVLHRTRTGDDGAFALSAGRPGTYVLIASSSRHRPHAGLVTVDGREVYRDVALVEHGGLTGTVRDRDGLPVAGATVTVTDATGGVVAVRRSGADGAWEVADAEPGTYTVAVLAAGREPVAARVVVGGGGAATHDVELPVASYALEGTVRGAGGRATGEALVVLVGADGAVVGSTVTADDGHFRFTGLAAGRHMLTASGFAPVSREVTVRPGSADSEAPVDVVVDPPQTGGPPEPTVADLRRETPVAQA